MRVRRGLSRRAFLGAGLSSAAVLALPKGRHMNDTVTQVQSYRQQLSPTTLTTSFAEFTVPDHPGSSISLEAICFFDFGGTATVNTADQIRVAVFRPGPTVLTLFTSGSVFAEASWLATGTPAGTTFAMNPGSDPFLAFSPPVRLSPNDAPTNIIFRNDTGARCPQNLLAVLIGFEIWSNDLTRQYPAPQHLAGAKS